MIKDAKYPLECPKCPMRFTSSDVDRYLVHIKYCNGN